MAWDKRKYVVQSDNETRHSPRQKRARPPVSDDATKFFTSIIDIPDFVGQVDGEIFICATDTGMDIIIKDDPPMVQDAGEAITPIVEIID